MPKNAPAVAVRRPAQHYNWKPLNRQDAEDGNHVSNIVQIHMSNSHLKDFWFWM